MHTKITYQVVNPSAGTPFWVYTRALEMSVREGKTFDPANPDATPALSKAVLVTTLDRDSYVTATSDAHDDFGLGAAVAFDQIKGLVCSLPDDCTSTTTTYANDTQQSVLHYPTVVKKSSTAPAPIGTVTRTSALHYDQLGRLDELTREPSAARGLYRRAHVTARDAFGQPKTVVDSPSASDTDPEARALTIGYDADGVFVQTATNSLNQTSTTIFHGGLGVPLSSTDLNKLSTTFSYDGFGRFRQAVTPDGMTANLDRTSDATHPMIETWSAADGSELVVYLDRLGREVRRRLRGGPPDCVVNDARALCATGTPSYIDTSYDPLGQLKTISRPYRDGDPVYTAAGYLYDNIGRITMLEFACNQGGTSSTCSDIFAYAGQRSEIYDATFNESAVERDATGRIARTMIYPSGAGKPAVTTSYDYREFGQLWHVKDANNNTVTMDYDLTGRGVSVDDRDTGKRSVQFDAFDEPRVETDAKGQSTTTLYDKIGRPRSRTTVDSHDKLLGADTLIWDTAPGAGQGRLASQTRAAVTTYFTYDAYGRFKNQHWAIDGVGYDYDYGYDSLGRFTSVQYPAVAGASRFQTDRVYNKWGGLYQLRDLTSGTPRPIWSAVAADAEGHLTQERLGNGLTPARSFFPRAASSRAPPSPASRTSNTPTT